MERDRLGFGLGIVCGAVLGFALAQLPLDSLPTTSAFEAMGVVVPGVIPDSVLVIDVRDRERAAAVRAAIADERIVVESSHGFALRERRLIVSSLEEAGELLDAAGWQDAGLQILRFEPVRGSERERSRKPSDVQRLAELMEKPTLSYFEAQQALTLL